MAKLSELFRRLRFGSLAVLFIAVQAGAALAPFVYTQKAHASTVPSNQTDIASFPFKLASQATYTEPGGQPTAAGSFSNGNVGPYVEGSCIPAILEVTNNSNSTGDIPVSPVYDFLNDHTAIENLEMLGDSGTAGNALDNPRAAADNLNDYAYPGTSLSGATSFYSSNGTVEATSSGPFSGNNDGTVSTNTTDTFRHYNITLQDVDAGETVYVIFCARLGLDASEYNGSSLSIRTAQGGQENIPIPVNSLLRRPSITITKIVSSGSALPSDFTFNVSPSINGQSLFTIPTGQNHVLIDDIFPDGTFTITENTVTGYEFTSGSGTNCTFSDSTATATVVAAKDPTNASCTFTNGQVPGSITIVKNADPNDLADFGFTATGSGVSNFTLDDDGGVPGADTAYDNEQIFNGLTPGDYVFTEDSVGGWDLTTISCPNASVTKDLVNRKVTVHLVAGDNVTCTFTNTKRGHLIVQKTTFPSGDQTEFSIRASGSGTITGGDTGVITDLADKDFEVTPGTYSVEETVPNGWQKTGDTCQDVFVGAGKTVTCTITNTQNAMLTIVKDALPDGTNQEFSFTGSDGMEPSGFTLDDNAVTAMPNSQEFSLAPGSYVVTEGSAEGWELTDITCPGTEHFKWPEESTRLEIDLAAGDEVACTFINTQYGSISGLKNEVNMDQSLVGTLEGWTINLLLNGDFYDSTTTLSDGSYSFGGLLPGSYTVQEVNQEGWTQIIGEESCLEQYELELSAGQDSGDNDFCNFENGSISGYKFNDKDGDGDYEPGDGELKIAEWPFIFYYDDNDNGLFDEQGIDFQTDVDGNFKLEDLKPGKYQICEDPQTELGWVRTSPATSNCRSTTINLSDEAVSGLQFGNQGRGNIQVTKNVDTDGDGQTDVFGSSDWLWNIDGSGDYFTGTTQEVAAGTYIVSEEQQNDYHVTDLTCGEQSYGAVESGEVTVGTGETVTCTFVNTRDTGEIRVNKIVEPEDDEGRFDLLIGENVEAEDVGDEGSTGFVRLVTGTYSISEQAGNEDTSLADYKTVYECLEGRTTIAVGEGTVIEGLVLESDDSIDCYFTNTRYAEVTVTKYEDLNRNGQFDEGENVLEGWNISLDCQDNNGTEQFLIQLSENDCSDHEDVTSADGDVLFEGVDPGHQYVLSESLEGQDGWFWSNTNCDTEGGLDGDNQYFMSPAAGEEITCFIGNYREPVLNLDKTNDSPTADNGDIVTYTLTVSLPEDSGALFDTSVVDLPPEGFTYVSGSWTANSSVRGDIKGTTTTEPTYASPGTWQLGNMLPGEVVTLTYQAEIGDEVFPGTYPDVAFAAGCATDDEECSDENTVFSNLSTEDDPFVGTEVSLAGRVLGVSDTVVLVNTGMPMLWAVMFTSALMLAGGVMASRVKTTSKGGRR